MTIDLEKQLRDALRPAAPPEGFAERIAARIEAVRLRRRRPSPLFLWAPAALAASLVLGFAALHQWELRREQQQGLQARRELIEALRVTGEKLDLAYRGVSDASRPANPDDAGT
jgi:hypothetical protein